MSFETLVYILYNATIKDGTVIWAAIVGTITHLELMQYQAISLTPCHILPFFLFLHKCLPMVKKNK